jgi:GntR family transcriptional regulator/MocR family aminotransferase
MDYALLLGHFERRQDLAGWPRQRVIHACLRAAILDGRLSAGTRLLSSRELAAELGAARNTVLYAYDQLAAEGLLDATRRGTVVARLGPQTVAEAPTPSASFGLSQRTAALRSLPPPGTLSTAFAPGVPALDEFPVALWRRLLDREWRGITSPELDYADPAGLLPLRQALAEYLRAARGLRCEPEQVIVTTGTQASLELCAHSLADAGQTAWVENPGYVGALAAFRAAQLRTVGIAVDEEGIAPTARDWKRAPPRLLYITPSHQYPIGGVLGLPRRLELLAQARRTGALIIEDDYDAEFRHDGPPLPAMQGLEPDAPVIYLGTFSKSMFPGMRTGFMVVPPALAAPLRATLARMPSHGRVAEQAALAAFIREGHFMMHLRRMRHLYRERRDALLQAIEAELGGHCTVYGASTGMHLALQFNDPSWNDAALSAQALAAGIAAAALSTQASGLRSQPWNGLVLGYSQVPAAEMRNSVRKLAGVLLNGTDG